MKHTIKTHTQTVAARRESGILLKGEGTETGKGKKREDGGGRREEEWWWYL